MRHLKPTEAGLPLEIYCFTATVAWGEYEAIQADMFDHLFAILPNLEPAPTESPRRDGCQRRSHR